MLDGVRGELYAAWLGDAIDAVFFGKSSEFEMTLEGVAKGAFNPFRLEGRMHPRSLMVLPRVLESSVESVVVSFRFACCECFGKERERKDMASFTDGREDRTGRGLRLGSEIRKQSRTVYIDDDREFLTGEGTIESVGLSPFSHDIRVRDGLVGKKVVVELFSFRREGIADAEECDMDRLSLGLEVERVAHETGVEHWSPGLVVRPGKFAVVGSTALGIVMQRPGAFELCMPVRGAGEQIHEVRSLAIHGSEPGLVNEIGAEEREEMLGFPLSEVGSCLEEGHRDAVFVKEGAEEHLVDVALVAACREERLAFCEPSDLSEGPRRLFDDLDTVEDVHIVKSRPEDGPGEKVRIEAGDHALQVAVRPGFSE